jgi:hemoglobin
MHPLIRRRSATVAACLAGLMLAVPAFAADPAAPDPKALDRYLYTSLRVVINHGVELYNANRVEDCYDQFRQSLQDLIPVLAGHPDIQKDVKEGLDKVEKDPEWRVKMAARATMPNPELAPVVRQKAFALRAVFNDVRAGLNPEPRKPTPPVTATLWDRLGGEKGVSKVVDDFATLVGADPKVDITRGGTRKLDELAVADLKKKSIEFISANTGGPLKYTGKSMKAAHKGMGITDEEFDAAVADFAKALTKNNVNAEAAAALLKFVETTRKDVVEGKKPVDKPKPTEGGTVKGKVTAGGKPLAKGTVSLTDKDGKAYSTAIAADGTFALEGVPAGAYKVAVTGGPAKFADPATSGLTLTVAKGQQNFDVELK